MILDETSIIEVIREPRSGQKINSAKTQESQLRVFTENLSEDEIRSETYWNEFQSTMKKRSSSKFPRVIQFARFPLPVVHISDSVLTDFFKVFEGKNKYFNAEGDREIPRLIEWIEENKPSQWIENEAREVYKNKPCSFVVVDRDDQGEPYLINVGSDRLVDAMIKNNDGDCEYICFIHSQKAHETKPNVTTTFFSVYDDLKYYVYSKDSDSDEIKQIKAVLHGIGYCPAKTFVKSKSNEKNPFKRRVAFSSALSKMEDWSMFDIFRNYVDHYAPFPVTEAPVNKCPNPDCQDGKVSVDIVDKNHSDGGYTRYIDCEVCSGSKDGQNIMPGTHIGVKVNPDNKNNGEGVFRMIFPDTDKLKYTPDKLDDLEMEIRFKVVGVNNMTNEAFNELQVKGSFAGMETILIRTKNDLDHLYKWIVKTVGLLFYKNLKIKVEANFGTEFYLTSEEDLQKRFFEAKKIGLPVEEQFNIYRQLVETKYKGNSAKLDRNLMMLDLDPFPMYSIEECFKLKAENVINGFDLSLKVNFLKFISKFENENVSIQQFGNELDYWKRIELIRTSIEKYNEDLIRIKDSRSEKKVDPIIEDPKE